MRMKECDEFMNAFWTRYGQLEFWGIPWWLTNTPVTFQADIAKCVQPCINDFAVYYHDNILIHSANEKEHEDLVQKVLQRLQQVGHYCKAEKCRFGFWSVGCLGFVINLNWNYHGLRLHIHDRRLAATGLRLECVHTRWLNKYLLEIHAEICEVDGSLINLAIEARLMELGINSEGQNHLSEVQTGLYRRPDLSTIQTVNTDYFADQCKQLNNG